jgi:hypothetical protein
MAEYFFDGDPDGLLLWHLLGVSVLLHLLRLFLAM